MVKDWKFPPKLRNRLGQSALTTCTQHSAEGSSVHNEEKKKEKKKERESIWKSLDEKSLKVPSTWNKTWCDFSESHPPPPSSLEPVTRSEESVCVRFPGQQPLSLLSSTYTLILWHRYMFSFDNTKLIKTWSLKGRLLQGDKQQVLQAVNSWDPDQLGGICCFYKEDKTILPKET